MSKNQYPPILFLFLFISAPLLAQHSIDGKVIDSRSEPISYANVILLNAEDSTSVVKGAVTSEEGIYKFENIKPAEYILKISFVGYEDHMRRIEVDGDVSLEEVLLQELTSDLGEVAITVKSPSIRREVDRLVFEVENSSLSTGNTWDILRKTPMVIVANGGLQVRNQTVEVYINDRKVHLTPSELRNLLENYSAENIKSIEVITNPPSRYDAEGGAILNIVTSKSISPGYKGNINGSWTQAIFPKFSIGTSHYLKTDKLNLFANYSFSPRKEFKEDDSYINFIENGEVVERWETDFDRTTRSKAHNANLMLDYFLSERNTLSFSSNAVISPGKTFDNNVLTEIYGPQGARLSQFRTQSDLEDDLSNIGMDLQFKRQLEKEGAEISAKAHFTRYDQDREQHMETLFTNAEQEENVEIFSTDADQGINIFTGQIDYFTPWGGSSLEMGAKASVIDSESGIRYFNEGGVPDGARSDVFHYDEKIYAGYASLSKDWEKWSLKAGLRGEFADQEGVSFSTEDVDSRENFDLFPTFFLMHSINENHSFSFDYSRRIQRPRYESLNPFRYYLNAFNFNAGNPELRAAISDNFNLNYTYKNQYFFDIYYRDNGPRSEIFSFQDNENRILRNVSVNLLESISYGLDFNYQKSLTSFWYFGTYMSLFHESQTFLALESNNVEVTKEIDGFYGQFANYLTLSKDGTFTGDLSFIYISNYLSGSYNLDPMATLSIGLRKTFWDNRAELSLHLEDLLDETNTRLTSRYLNQDNSYFARPESRYVRLGFKYNFGNFRLSDNQRTIQAQERERL